MAQSARLPAAQSVGFCRSADGTRIAFARYGDGPPLVVSTCWLSHLEYDLQSPVWKHFVHGLAEVSASVRYDERGFGLSDWDVTDFSFEARLQDLEAVVEAAGLDRFALLGMSQGGPVAVAYAHRHPERVTRLALLGSYVGMVGDGSEESRQLEETFTKMIEVGWARPEGRFRRVFTDALMPGATPEQMTWVDELMRRSTTSENAVAFRRARMDVDVSDLLPLIDVPTLVMHSRGDQMNPLEGGRRLAAEIPGAQLVTLETDNHVLLDGEPATDVCFAELAAFLAPDAEPRVPTVPRQGPDARSGEVSSDASSLDRLTPREREVLNLVAAGRDNREIAEQLTLSVRTVERHLQTIYRKLDLAGSAQRTAAAALALGADDYARAATGG
jgi:pimeloyl-ACP methyl ester carboxylesterase/DNA-binding CsgD family transcriptional regulator